MKLKLEQTLELLKKNLRLYSEDPKIEYLFEIGYYFSHAEYTLPKCRRIEKNLFINKIKNEEYLEINEYLEEIKNYYLDVKAKYNF